MQKSNNKPNNASDNNSNGIINAGFINDASFSIPDYKSRYDWFCEEFVKFNTEIPETLIFEYELLYKMFGETEHDKSIEAQLQKFKVYVTDEIPMPDIVLSFCDVNGGNKRMVMTRQNISCVTAQAKAGKTFLVKLIVSSVLKKNTFQNRLLSELPDGSDKILYIDTEQSKYHVRLGLSHIKELLTEDLEQLNRMDVYQFDSVSTLSRTEYVKWLIYNGKYDFVVIDGISDLALDTNNLKEADELVTNLRIWATENNCHILNVIHQNPNDLQTKMKGHLGTKLQDKSEIVIGVSVDKDNDNNRIVQSLASRNRKPEPFEFTISEHGLPSINNNEVSESKITGKRANKTDKPDYQLYQLLTSAYSKKKEVLFFRYGELITAICIEFEKVFKENIGDTATRKLLAKFIDNGWILKSGEVKHTQYYLGDFNNNNDSNSDVIF